MYERAPLEIHTRHDLPSDQIEVFVLVRDTNRRVAFFAEPLTMKKHEDGALASPTLRLARQDAQQWIDALWSAGLRPTEGAGSVGALAATERHLADMRQLVFARK